MDELSAGKYLQIDFYRNKTKPQAAWKRRKQNKKLLYNEGNGQQRLKVHIIMIKNTTVELQGLLR